MKNLNGEWRIRGGVDTSVAFVSGKGSVRWPAVALQHIVTQLVQQGGKGKKCAPCLCQALHARRGDIVYPRISNAHWFRSLGLAIGCALLALSDWPGRRRGGGAVPRGNRSCEVALRVRGLICEGVPERGIVLIHER